MGNHEESAERITGKYFIGVDVGTQSVRAALVTESGKILKTSADPILTWNPCPDHYEQSSESIWASCCKLVKELAQMVPREAIAGIGFDATCSLVVLDEKFSPLSISTTGNENQNVILWMDHRAQHEANLINSTRHSVLQYVGGQVSVEMEIPKLLWIKKHLPQQWKKAGHFFDLPDFLTWKATASLSRSLCSLVCKWCYVAGEKKGWDEEFFQMIDLEDLIKNNFHKIGNYVLAPGEVCGKGLTEKAAREMGLLPGTAVGTSIIDAHSGGIGMLGCQAEVLSSFPFSSRLCVIAGTSTCHMVVKEKPIFIPGIWGPYFSAMVPNMWLNEAGQSAAGKLIDHIISIHPAAAQLENKGRHIQEILQEEALKLAVNCGYSSVSYLTTHFHVWPDFHGNRSPLADPSLRGMICGLDLSRDKDDLVRTYVATIQALAYGTRHIISSLESAGHSIQALLMCGGLVKNQLYVQLHADITGLPVILPDETESVLLGAAMLGAKASGIYSTVEEAMCKMAGRGRVVFPNENDRSFHDGKYDVFLELMECQKRCRDRMIKTTDHL